MMRNLKHNREKAMREYGDALLLAVINRQPEAFRSERPNRGQAAAAACPPNEPKSEK